MRLLLGICLAALGLGGCGQKGPLLPDRSKVVVTRGAAARRTDAAAEAADRRDDPSQP